MSYSGIKKVFFSTLVIFQVIFALPLMAESKVTCLNFDESKRIIEFSSEIGEKSLSIEGMSVKVLDYVKSFQRHDKNPLISCNIIKTPNEKEKHVLSTSSENSGQSKAPCKPVVFPIMLPFSYSGEVSLKEVDNVSYKNSTGIKIKKENLEPYSSGKLKCKENDQDKGIQIKIPSDKITITTDPAKPAFFGDIMGFAIDTSISNRSYVAVFYDHKQIATICRVNHNESADNPFNLLPQCEFQEGKDTDGKKLIIFSAENPGVETFGYMTSFDEIDGVWQVNSLEPASVIQKTTNFILDKDDNELVSCGEDSSKVKKTFITKESAEEIRKKVAELLKRINQLNPNRNLEESLDLYNKVLELDPKFTCPRQKVIEILWLLGRNEEAISHAYELQYLDPKNYFAAQWIGLLKWRAGDFEEAERLIKLSATLKPELGTPYHQLATIYAELGKENERSAALEEGLKREPKSAALLVSKAALEKSKGNESTALILFNEVIAIIKEELRLLILSQGSDLRMGADSAKKIEALGFAYNQLSKFSSSEMAFKTALVLDPSNINVPVLLGQQLSGLKRANEANQYLLKAEKINGLDKTISLFIASNFEKLERFEEAREKYKELLVKFPNSGQAHLDYGAFLHRRDEINEAIKYYNRAAELMPNSPWPLNNRGSAKMYMRDFISARADLEAAAKIAPEDFSITANLQYCKQSIANPPSYVPPTKFQGFSERECLTCDEKLPALITAIKNGSEEGKFKAAKDLVVSFSEPADLALKDYVNSSIDKVVSGMKIDNPDLTTYLMLAGYVENNYEAPAKALAEIAKTDKREIQANALNALSKYGANGKAGEEISLQIFSRKKDGCRSCAFEVLSALGSDNSKVFEEALSDPESDVVYSALKNLALGENLNCGFAAKLKDLVINSDDETRDLALYSLVMLKVISGCDLSGLKLQGPL